MVVSIGGGLGLLTLLGMVEYIRHQRRLKAVGVRVHVNGTRGKSATTRLIAAGLRAAGFRVIAKTTGSAPRLILEDGSEIPFQRRGPANIIEQLRVVALAAKRRADAVVIECMAIEPELQWISESRLIRAHIGVITNVRLDHTDQMGDDRDSVADALGLTIPGNGVLVTGALRYMERFKARAERLRTTVVGVSADCLEKGVMKRFSRQVFRENVALAVEVCARLGVDSRVALAGMAAAGEDPGSVLGYRLVHGGRTFYLVNAFAANDPQSTLKKLLHWRAYRRKKGLSPDSASVVGVFNNRMDRGFRVDLFMRHFLPKSGLEDIVVCGQSPGLVRRKLMRAGFGAANTMAAGSWFRSWPVKGCLDRLAQRYEQDLVLFGFGNIKGAGWDFLSYFSTHGKALS